MNRAAPQLHISWFDAAASGDVPRLSGLLRLRNALDINTQLSASGKTALYQACDWNRPAAVKFLLEKGADPRIAARDGSTALDRCVAHEFAECTELIRAALTSDRRRRQRVRSRRRWSRRRRSRRR